MKPRPMAIRDLPCFNCKHFDWKSSEYVCAAFPGGIPWREKGTLLMSTVREGKEPQGHARKRLMQAA